MSARSSTGVGIGEMLVSAAARQEDTERAALLLAEAETELGVVLQDIALDAIESDPAQPRKTFDPAKLESLAESIRRYGVLQEPGVVATELDGAGLPTRFRLVWGERRWRAARIAGLTHMLCKVLPRGDDSAAEQLKKREQQWAENAEREGLSPVEEAHAIEEAVKIERQVDPDAPVGELVERVGAQRGLNPIVARNLVGLLKTPQCLQAALLKRSIGREVGFELARYWSKLLEQHDLGADAKREIRYRNLVEAWATARGMALDASAMSQYAAETAQDSKTVKATCRKAEDAERVVRDRFRGVVERAQKQKWTLARARALLASGRAKDDEEAVEHPTLFEFTGKAKPKLTVYLDRARDPAVGTSEAKAELVQALRKLIEELEARPSVESANTAAA